MGGGWNKRERRRNEMRGRGEYTGKEEKDGGGGKEI